jgi:hypothetical protein
MHHLQHNTYLHFDVRLIPLEDIHRVRINGSRIKVTPDDHQTRPVAENFSVWIIRNGWLVDTGQGYFPATGLLQLCLRFALFLLHLLADGLKATGEVCEDCSLAGQALSPRGRC